MTITPNPLAPQPGDDTTDWTTIKADLAQARRENFELRRQVADLTSECGYDQRNAAESQRESVEHLKTIDDLKKQVADLSACLALENASRKDLRAQHEADMMRIQACYQSAEQAARDAKLHADRRLALLRKIEWSGATSIGAKACPCCRKPIFFAHSETCMLWQEIEGEMAP